MASASHYREDRSLVAKNFMIFVCKEAQNSGGYGRTCGRSHIQSAPWDFLALNHGSTLFLLNPLEVFRSTRSRSLHELRIARWFKILESLEGGWITSKP